MQFKTTMKYPFIPTRMAVIKVLDNDKCWKGCGEIAILIHCRWDIDALEKFDSFLKVKYIDPKQWKSYVHLKTCTQMFTAALFTMTKN